MQARWTWIRCRAISVHHSMWLFSLLGRGVSSAKCCCVVLRACCVPLVPQCAKPPAAPLTPGDVQPYVALALELIKTRGHRVRIATHATFGAMVDEASVQLAGLTSPLGEPLTGRLEHFNIGGSPEELMSYMVKNPGLVPGLASLTNGDIRRKRKMVKAMLVGCYRACFSPNERTKLPFAADAIISNPPAFAHIHVAEALGIPLLMSFSEP